MTAYHYRPCSRTVRRLVLVGALPAGVAHTAREIQIARDRIASGIASLVNRGHFKGQHRRPTNEEGWQEWLRLQTSSQGSDTRRWGTLFGEL